MASLADIFRTVVDEQSPVGFRGYDRSVAGPRDAAVVVEVRSQAALRYLLSARPQLGLARAYVAGAVEVHGDLHAALRGLLSAGARYR